MMDTVVKIWRRLRAFALKGTELAQASVGTIRLKLFKLAADEITCLATA